MAVLRLPAIGRPPDIVSAVMLTILCVLLELRHDALQGRVMAVAMVRSSLMARSCPRYRQAARLVSVVLLSSVALGLCCVRALMAGVACRITVPSARRSCYRHGGVAR